MDLIDVGSTPNSHEGDSLRAAFQKANANFEELHDIIVAGVDELAGITILTDVPLTSIGVPDNTVGNIATDIRYLYVCVMTFDGSTAIWRRIEWNGDTW